MKRLAGLLGEEVSAWPEVTTRLMFGYRAIYRQGVVFAMLPEKRSLEVAGSIACKLGVWRSVEVSPDNVAAVLRALEKAYRAARRK